MFQIWRYRTSWEDFHSSTSWLKIFFDIFGESNGIWSNKIWTESWLASEGLSSYQSPHMTPCAWCLYYRCMTSWQHDNSEDISSILTQPADSVLHAPYPGYSHTCMRRSSPVSVSVSATFTIYSEWPGASQQGPASIPLLTIHITHAPSSGQIILFGRGLSLSCPERLMRQNESLTPYLGLILGLPGLGRRNCQNVDTRLGMDVNFLPNTRLPEYPHT